MSGDVKKEGTKNKINLPTKCIYLSVFCHETVLKVYQKCIKNIKYLIIRKL
jgi:hypothetical protein